MRAAKVLRSVVLSSQVRAGRCYSTVVPQSGLKRGALELMLQSEGSGTSIAFEEMPDLGSIAGWRRLIVLSGSQVELLVAAWR